MDRIDAVDSSALRTGRRIRPGEVPGHLGHLGLLGRILPSWRFKPPFLILLLGLFCLTLTVWHAQVLRLKETARKEQGPASSGAAPRGERDGTALLVLGRDEAVTTRASGPGGGPASVPGARSCRRCTDGPSELHADPVPDRRPSILACRHGARAPPRLLA